MPDVTLEQVGDDIKATINGKSYRVKGTSMEAARQWAEQKGMTVTGGATPKQPLPPGVQGESMGIGGMAIEGFKDPFLGAKSLFTELTGSPEDIAKDTAEARAREQRIRGSTADPDALSKRIVRAAANPVNIASMAAPELGAARMGPVAAGLARGAVGGAVQAGLEPVTGASPGRELGERETQALKGGAIGAAMGGIGGQAGRVAKRLGTSPEELRKITQGQYDYLKSSNLTLDGQPFRANITTIKNNLIANGFHPQDEPKVFNAIEGMENHNGDLGMLDIERYVSRLSKIGRTSTDPSERKAAYDARTILMTYLGQVPQSHVVLGNINDLAVLRDAIGNYASLMQGERLDKALVGGELRAATTGTGKNVENAIRQEVRKIIASPSVSRRYTKDQIDDMTDVAGGGTIRNWMRAGGKFGGVLRTTLPLAVGSAVGSHTGSMEEGTLAGAAGLAIPYALGKVGEHLTKEGVRDVADKVYRASPHYTANPPKPSPWAGPASLLGKAAPAAAGLVEEPNDVLGPQLGP
jgi:hypothetical protein